MKKTEITKLKSLAETALELNEKLHPSSQLSAKYKEAEDKLRKSICDALGGYDDNNVETADRLKQSKITTKGRQLDGEPEYQGILAEFAKIDKELTATLKELNPLITKLAAERRDELSALYEANLVTISKAMLPWCEDEEEATEMARILNSQRNLHKRMMEFYTGNTAYVSAGNAQRLARELETELPAPAKRG